MPTKPSFLLTLLVAATLSVAGCAKKTPEEHLQQGKDLLAKGDKPGAVVALKNTLQAQPGNAEARLLLGRLQLEAGNYPGAVKELTQARDKGAPESDVLPDLAKAHLGAGEVQAALDLGIPTHTFGPQARAALYTQRAFAQQRLGKQADADKSIEAAKEADPRWPDLLVYQAREALFAKHQDQAMQWVEEALKSDPKHLEALFLKAALQQFKGDSEGALKTYRSILAQDPTQGRAHLAVSDLLGRQGKLDEADKALASAEKVAGNMPIVRYARGIMDLRRGKLKEASEALGQVLKVAPDNISVLLAHASAHMGLGNFEQSQKSAQRVLGIQADNPMALRILAASQAKSGAPKQALATLAPLLKANVNDPSLLAQAGSLALRGGDFGKATAYLDKASDLAPDNATIKTRLAAAHLATGQRGEAMAELEAVARESNQVSKADLALIMLHLKDKAFDKALKAIDALEKKLPNSPDTHNLRAGALLGKQDRAGARRELEKALTIQPGYPPALENLARMDLQDNRPQDARKRYEALLQKDKAHLPAMMALASLAARAGDTNAAVSWLEKASKAQPSAMPPRERLVRHYLAQKNFTRALAVAKEAAVLNPDAPLALDLLGSTQLAVGDARGAIDTFTRLTEKDRGTPEAFLRLGVAQLTDKQAGPARASLQQALKLKPDHAPALEALLRLEMSDKHPQAALKIARDLQTSLPKSPLGFEREGDVQMALNQPGPALKAYESAMQKGANTSVMVKIHRVLVLSGKSKDADSRLSGWLRQHPGDPALTAYAAQRLIIVGREMEALPMVEALARQSPNNPIVVNNLASLYHKAGDKRALATAEKAHKLAPDYPAIQDTLGWILVEQGKVPQGLELLIKAAGKQPKDAEIRYHYVAALAQSGDRIKARSELERFLADFPKSPQSEQARAKLKSL